MICLRYGNEQKKRSPVLGTNHLELSGLSPTRGCSPKRGLKACPHLHAHEGLEVAGSVKYSSCTSTHKIGNLGSERSTVDRYEVDRDPSHAEKSRHGSYEGTGRTSTYAKEKFRLPGYLFSWSPLRVTSGMRDITASYIRFDRWSTHSLSTSISS